MEQLLELENAKLVHNNPDAHRQVYIGTHRRYGPVAVKVVGFTSDHTLDIARREAKIALRTQHPSICKVLMEKVLELEDDSDYHYLVILMPQVSSDLDKEIAKRRNCSPPKYWDEDNLWNMLLQVTDALRYAQGRGICHRDIKPANLLIDENERVYVADFGAGKVVVPDATGNLHTLTGTIAYFSPEMQANFCSCLSSGLSQFDYNPYKSDVFSLGVTLVNMMTLERPPSLGFDQNFPRKVDSYLLKLRTRYSEELLTIVGAMLELNPVLRPSFLELGEMLAEIRGHSAIQPMSGNFYISHEHKIRLSTAAPHQQVQPDSPLNSSCSQQDTRRKVLIESKSVREVRTLDPEIRCDTCLTQYGSRVKLRCGHSVCNECVDSHTCRSAKRSNTKI